MAASSFGAADEREANCVGNPPRQTEDPLSPACVPFFDDETNGGATDRGVTEDEIRLVLYNDLGIDGDMNEPWRPSDEGHDAALSDEQRDLVRTIKSDLRYFSSRFQTYRRTVRVIARSSALGAETSCAQRQADAVKVRLSIDPFAAISFGGGETSCFASYLADAFGRPTFAYGDGVSRTMQHDRPGMVWSFLPSLQQQARASAGFICRKLAGRPASFTDDPLLKGDRRTFGLIYPSGTAATPELRDAALALRAALARCGAPVHAEPFRGAPHEVALEAPVITGKLKAAGTTTVICYCSPRPPQHAVTLFQRSATALAYRPEWFWDSFSEMDKPMWQQGYGDRQQISFGASHTWRASAFREQRHVQAYLEQEPSSLPNARYSTSIYHMYLQAFTAIQLAGPNLNAGSVATGLRTHAVDRADNPFVPLASYGEADAFVDSFTGWWWDPNGTPPDGRSGEGCRRLLAEGAPFEAATWPRGDRDLFVTDAPCTAPTEADRFPPPGDF